MEAGLGFGFKKGFDPRRDIEVAKRNMIPYGPGEAHPMWRGGVTEEYDRVRKVIGINKWNTQVKRRDNYTCQKCGVYKIKRMSVHHIKPMLDYPELALDIDNGITLCASCHAKVHWEELRKKE